MSTQLVYGSLQDVARTSGKGIAHAFLNVVALILVDTSSSMDANDCPGQRRRYDLACEQLIRLQREIPGKIGVISWNEDAKFCPGGIPTSPYSDTDLVKALNFVKPADGTGIRLILISDGEPNDEKGALAVARTFKSKIDCIYIGPEAGGGRDFLKRLAAATGGQSDNLSIKNLGQLSQTVKKLITA